MPTPRFATALAAMFAFAAIAAAEPPASQPELAAAVPAWQCDKMPFDKAVESLRDQCKLNIVVNWAAVQGENVTRATEVTVAVKDATVAAALRELLDAAAGLQCVLGFVLREGVITISSLADLDLEAPIVPPDPAVAAAMDKKLPEVKFDATPLVDALKTLAELAKVSIQPNWTAMNNAGVGRATAVSLTLKDVTARSALRHLLIAAVGREHAVDFAVRGKAVVVSSAEDLRPRV
ncbi:MAG: STN domain-containing protein, partial [Phycisphaerae bacterium]|nr:STN domain-containing protein [Phycisphaerae bacterium]